MNIFEYHLKEIQNLILVKNDILKLEKIENLENINLEVPPDKFNFDLSCNAKCHSYSFWACQSILRRVWREYLCQKNTKIIDSHSQSKFDESGFFENHVRRRRRKMKILISIYQLLLLKPIKEK